MTKDILLIAYHFPPLNSVASSRTYSFARYLTEFGHRVTVLTADHQGDGCSFSVDPSATRYRVVTACRVESRNRNEELLREGEGAAADRFANLKFRLKKRASYHLLGNLVTTADSWYGAARKALFRLLEQERFDVVISSFSPISAHWLAYAMKAHHPDVCWIADYRDLWSLNECVPRPVFPLSALQGAGERFLNRRADAIVTVSEPLRDALAAKFRRPTFVVENGYFPEDEGRGAALDPGFTRRYTFSYTGSIYRFKQDPAPFFQAVQELVAEGRISVDEIDIRFYGDNSYLLREKVRDLGLDRIVSLLPLVSRDESCAIQRQSTGLLFLESDDPASRGVLTGKLFEYLVAGRPIIAVGISELHAAGHLIAETGTGYVCGNDIAMIKGAIMASVNGTSLKPDQEKIAAYRRDRLVARLDAVISQVCRKGPARANGSAP